MTKEIKEQIIAALDSGTSTKTECAKRFSLTYYQISNMYHRHKEAVELEERGRGEMTEEIKQQIIAALDSGTSTRQECAEKFGLMYYQVNSMYQRHKEAVKLKDPQGHRRKLPHQD